MFDLFQFTEKTTRLRRNLLVFALLCFCVGFFNVSVESIPLGGYAIKLPPQAFEFALLSMLIYHFITFYWAAYDEYKHWELTVADKVQVTLDLNNQIRKHGFLHIINQQISYIKKSDETINKFNKLVFYINNIMGNKEISDEKLSILSDNYSKIEECYNDIKEIMEQIERIKINVDDFENKFKKYRIFTIIRICFVEILIPFIATLVAFVWGVMQFSILAWIWVD